MDKQQKIYERTKEILVEKGFILDQSNKTFIRFSSQRLDNIVGFVGNGWTQSKRLLLFEIENRESRYTLKLLIGPGKEKTRRLLHDIAKNNTQLYNKGHVQLTDTWTTIYSNKFLSKDEVASMTVEQIETVINKNLSEFVRKDLDMLCEVFEKEIEPPFSSTQWIIPCNTKYYDVVGAFNKFGIIEWKQSVNVEAGDIVYIYIGSPVQEIRYKCIVIEADLKETQIDDSEFVLDGDMYENYGRYMKLKLVEMYDEGMFLYKELKENGLSSVQGPSKVAEQLSLYMETMLQSKQIENDVIFNTDLNNTEKTAIIKSRIGHGTLKQRLLKKECACKICGLSDERFLIASHIKPWAQSNNQERLDLDNVLLLCPHHDAVFDKGYIAFNEEGELLVSDELSLETRALLNLTKGHKIKLRTDNKKYIEWHRENIFKP
ncbi:MAG: HNH endonuclease signature motif containing protein [Cellulosilyticum sp.]|nr:HNH endonuclease signature motif containing protein [Cellulosilyticum sp.]